MVIITATWGIMMGISNRGELVKVSGQEVEQYNVCRPVGVGVLVGLKQFYQFDQNQLIVLLFIGFDFVIVYICTYIP